MTEYFLAGGGLRLWQIIIYSSLWIVIGCFIAAIFRRMLGPEKVKRIFADGTRWGLVIGWLIGMLLPVCSLGVIPIVREMHRAGVKHGTIIAFGLTAPLFNPMSVLYGLTLSDPIAILSFSLCALVIVTFLGWCWGRLTSASDATSSKKTIMPSVGIKRSVSVIYTAARELTGPTSIYIGIGILCSVLLATFSPKGYLQQQVEVDYPLAPVVVALFATPIYSTPLLAMSQIGGMFQHGNSIGAAFSMLVLGAGTNIGLFCWIGRTYGLVQVLTLYLVLFGTTVGLAYAIDKPLYPTGVDPAGHTHAFDVYTNPFFPKQPQMTETAFEKAREFWAMNEFGGTYVLVILFVLGLVFALSNRAFDYETWFHSEGAKSTKLDRVLPGWVLGLTVVIGLVTASVIGCYLYYPAPHDLLADMSSINNKAVLAAKYKEWDAADKWIRISDDMSRRLEVGVFLRTGSVPEFQRTKAQVYREKLDKLKEAVDNRMEDRVGPISLDVDRAYRRMSRSFKDDDGQ